jgi:uncharacterized protein YxjI
MSGVYLMSRKWSLADRFTIADEAGVRRFEVQGRFGFTKRLSFRDASGAEVARGSFSGRNYTVARGGMAVATVSQQRTLRDRFAIEVADGEDAVLTLAVILVIETIRAARRAAASGG